MIGMMKRSKNREIWWKPENPVKKGKSKNIGKNALICKNSWMKSDPGMRVWKGS